MITVHRSVWPLNLFVSDCFVVVIVVVVDVAVVVVVEKPFSKLTLFFVLNLYFREFFPVILLASRTLRFNIVQNSQDSYFLVVYVGIKPPMKVFAGHCLYAASRLASVQYGAFDTAKL